MPELGEVAHAVSLLRKHVLNKVVTNVTAAEDELLFVKPLTSTSFCAYLTNSKVTEVGRQGKYFWLELDKTKTVLMHFGMTGWMHIRDALTHYKPMEQGGDKKAKQWILESGEEFKVDWPPKFTKFTFTAETKTSGNEVEVAFADPRRLGRVRVYECGADAMQLQEPLNKLGTDFSQAPLNEELKQQTISIISKRKAAMKSILLDQHVFSGIGNWMADEILFQSKIHPEQKGCDLPPTQLDAVYAAIIDVCHTAAELEGNTALFPKTWLMLHRWGKGRKQDQTTADGKPIDFVTVGGRTSCYVPSVQTKIKTETNEKRKNVDDTNSLSKKRSIKRQVD